MDIDQLVVRGSHRHFEDAGIAHISADADKLDARRSTASVTLKPVSSARQDHGGQGKSLDVIQRGWFVPEALKNREGRLIARLRAMSLDGLNERSLLSADVTAGTNEDR